MQNMPNLQETILVFITHIWH